MCNLKFLIIALIFVNSLIGFSETSLSNENTEVQSSQFAALNKVLIQKKLAYNLQWLRLLHYKKTLTGNYESQADGQDFFTSSEGKFFPEKELISFAQALMEPTIKVIKPPLNDIQFQLLPHCQFPARAHWLELQLKNEFDFHLDWSQCKDLYSFLNKLKADSATLIFSSYYMNNPSSTFGHTFLRLNRNSGSDLLSMGVNYAANSTSNNSFIFALYGLIGGFKGTFTVIPYYYKVREYNDYESRDLWEYELNLTSEELQQLTYHLWELQWTYFDYYFFTENCSYHMLTLLEAASPRINLISELPAWVIPSETIRVLAQDENLIKNISYRSSIRTQFNERLNNLNKEELNAFQQWKDKNSNWNLNLLPQSKAMVLDAGLDYLDFKYSKELLLDKNSSIANEKNHWLNVRSQLPMTPQLNVRPPIENSPDKAHSAARGGIRFNSDSTISPHWKFALHDFLDSTIGYPQDAHIDFMSLEWKYDKRKYLIDLEKLHVVGLTSISPISEFENNWSWKMNTGWEREPVLTQLGTPLFFSFGYGASVLIHEPSHFILYGLAHTKIAHTFENMTSQNFFASIGSLIGLRWLWTEKGSFSLEVLPEQIFFPSMQSRNRLSLFQTYKVSKNTFLDFRGEIYDKKLSSSVGLFHYF